MNFALRKEIRLLMPAWIVAMLAAALPIWVFRLDVGLMEQMSFILFAGGALLLSVSSFGMEMSLGTFPCLLAQPRPRVATWRLKIGVLAAALAFAVGAYCLSWWLRAQTALFGSLGSAARLENFQTVLLLVVMAFAGGLWTTLLFRQMAVAFWFAVLVPLVLHAACLPLLERWQEEGDSSLFMGALSLVYCAYAAAGYLLARRLFLRAEDKQAQEAGGAATLSFLPGFASTLRAVPWQRLLVKELRLHEGTLVISGVLVLLHLVALAAPIYFRAWTAKYPFIENTWMLWCLAPLLVGCSAIAEERRGRTLEGSLCLPVGRLRQFAVKVLVAFGIGAFLGAIMPWFLEQFRLGNGAGPFSPGERVVPWLLLTAAVITAIGIYASSLSESLLQALGIAVGLFLLWCLVFYLYWNYVFEYLRSFRSLETNSIVSAGLFYWSMLSPVVAALFFLGFANFQELRITRRVWVRNSLILALVEIGPPTLVVAFLLMSSWNGSG